MPDPLIVATDRGLYCEAGDFYIDPWAPVARAVITHAHSDHARPGSAQYLATRESLPLLKMRLGQDAAITSLEYAESVVLGGVRVTLHPAGHMLGAAQVRIEHRGRVAVVTGDFKWEADATCRPFEPLRCHHLIMESTFALPIFRWPAVESVQQDIESWWRANQEQGKTSVLLVYAIGKAQRVLALLPPAIGPVYAHGAVRNGCHAYRAAGAAIPEPLAIADAPRPMRWSEAMVLAPPLAHNSPWLGRFGRVSVAAVSGWMRIRGIRRRRSIDRGFVLSDHADWDGLLRLVKESGAERIGATHGYTASLVRYLRQNGLDAESLSTRYEGEPLDAHNEDESPEESALDASDERSASASEPM